MEGGCVEDLLVDLSETPETSPQIEPVSCSSPHDTADEDKENDDPVSVSDSIELARSDDSHRRHSLTLKSTPDSSNRILRDVTQESTGKIKHGSSSPVVRLLDEEEFDFDLPVSPATGLSDDSRSKVMEDEDEVFIGPVGFTERCMAAVVAADDPLIEDFQPMSPLNPEQIAELFKEANSVAFKLQFAKDGSEKENKSCNNSSFVPSLKFFSSSSNEKTPSPTKKRHSRGGTFTISKSPFELLSENQRKSLPVVDTKTEVVSNHAEAVKEQKEKDSKNNVRQSKLGVPKASKLTRLTIPSKTDLNKTSSNENVSAKKSDDASASHDVHINHGDKPQKIRKSLPKPGTIAANATSGPKKMSRLQPPGAVQRNVSGSRSSSINSSFNKSPNNNDNNTDTSVNGSRLQYQKSAGQLPTNSDKNGGKPSIRRSLTMPRSGVSPYLVNGQKKSETSSKIQKPENNDSAPKLKKLPQRSSLPNSKGPVNSSIPSSKGPVTKQQLLKPGDFQRKALAINRGKQTEPSQKAGPLKATIQTQVVHSRTVVKRKSLEPKSKVLSTAVPDSTPVKPDKRVQPKLLSNNFTTPRKSSASSVDSASSTPSSSRRRSCLPTPTKLRTSSLSSVPGQSPFCRKSSTLGPIRNASTSSCPDFDDQQFGFGQIDDRSPSSLQPRKPRVVNTPNLPQKRLSMWSPVKKRQPVNTGDEVFMCTKRTAYK